MHAWQSMDKSDNMSPLYTLSATDPQANQPLFRCFENTASTTWAFLPSSQEIRYCFVVLEHPVIDAQLLELCTMIGPELQSVSKRSIHTGFDVSLPNLCSYLSCLVLTHRMGSNRLTVHPHGPVRLNPCLALPRRDGVACRVCTILVRRRFDDGHVLILCFLLPLYV